jgi:hypothetical protein
MKFHFFVTVRFFFFWINKNRNRIQDFWLPFFLVTTEDDNKAGLQIIILLGRTNVWPSQKLVGHLSICPGHDVFFLPGHVSPHGNASIKSSVNHGSGYT